MGTCQISIACDNPTCASEWSINTQKPLSVYQIESKLKNDGWAIKRNGYFCCESCANQYNKLRR